MKKITIIGLLSLCAVGSFAQGTLVFYNDIGDLLTHIYSPQVATPGVEVQGDTDAELIASGYTAAGVYGTVPAAEAAVNPTGGQVTYTGTPVGGSSYSGTATIANWGTIANLYTYGNLFTAQIYALSAGDSANGSSLYNQYVNAQGTSQAAALATLPAFSALSPVSQYVTILQDSGGSSFGGFVISPTFPGGVDVGIPGTGYLGNGTTGQRNGNYVANNAAVALAAWYNAGGTITSLAQALSDGVPYGNSAVFLDTGLGEPASIESEAKLNNNQTASPTDMSNGGVGGLTSFSLTTPEPSTIALCVLGACAFLARRRK
jgi:hypothetical protein